VAVGAHEHERRAAVRDEDIVRSPYGLYRLDLML
jgi:hypothetical protein